MKKLFEEPTLECVRVTSEVVTSDIPGMGGEVDPSKIIWG